MPLAACITVHVTGNNPPHIHTIPKNYLDLCRGIIYRDDGQIEYLSLTYRIDKPLFHDMSFDFYPMSALRQDLSVASEAVINAYFDYSEEADEILEAANGRIEHRGPSFIEEWIDFQREYSSAVVKLGQQRADKRLFLYQQMAQEQYLARASMDMEDARALVSKPPRKRPEVKIGDFIISDSREINFGYLRSLAKHVLESPLRMQISKVPSRSGETSVFKNELRAQMKYFKTKNPLFSKLLSPVGLEVLFAPPRGENVVVRDIDNIMRTIVPIFHEEFSPPLSALHAVRLGEFPAKKRSEYADWFAKYPRGLNHQILNYEIFRIPPHSRIKIDGQVAVGLCDGAFKKNLFDKTAAVIRAWQESDISS